MLEHSLQSCLTPSLTPAPSQKKYNSRSKTNLKGVNTEIQEDPRPGVGRRKFKGFRIKGPLRTGANIYTYRYRNTDTYCFRETFINSNLVFINQNNNYLKQK